MKKPKRERWIVFKDNKGRVIKLPDSAKLSELRKLGVKSIRFSKRGEPLPNGWFRNV